MTLPFVNLLPTRSTYCRGAGYTFNPLTGLLTVDTSRTKASRKYRITAIPHGFRVTKLDKGTDATEDHYHVERADYSCCCRGFVRFGYCCHSDAVRDLDAAGYLEHGEERPVSPEPTEDEIDDMALRAAARWEELAEVCWSEPLTTGEAG